MQILSDILYRAGLLEVIGSTSVSISSIQFNSEKVEPGCLFVAVKGIRVNGHDFIDQSVEKGAIAVLCETLPKTRKEGVTFIRVIDSMKALGQAASNFYDNPSEKLKLVGITGTNGKTTTVTLLYEVFRKLGYAAGLLSTVE
ncbi:MAG: Mur ligase domain-containing protein, partial [Bacteroidetes bacterium]|nr:Mur ligase domain-containing protein [Bacteroidota bacterium]